MLKKLNKPEFTWGSINLVTPSEARQLYIQALRSADEGDYAALLAFVRT